MHGAIEGRQDMTDSDLGATGVGVWLYRLMQTERPYYRAVYSVANESDWVLAGKGRVRHERGGVGLHNLAAVLRLGPRFLAVSRRA